MKKKQEDRIDRQRAQANTVMDSSGPPSLVTESEEEDDDDSQWCHLVFNQIHSFLMISDLKKRVGQSFE